MAASITCVEPASRTGRLRLCAATLAAALTLASSVSRADPPGETSALARALFDEGRTLLAEKNYERACAKFEEAQRLDPGGGTLLNLALCNELRGQLATAWAQFDEALRWARRDRRADREQFAKEHLEAVRSHLSRLRLVVPAAARATGLVITRNGVEVGETTWDEWLPVDPGEHVIVAEAPGKITFRRSVTVGTNGARADLLIEPLRDRARPAQPKRSSSPGASVSPGVAPGATQRIAGLVLGGVGVIALGASAYFGVRALELDASSDDLCRSPRSCDPAAFDENRRAQRAAAAATGLAVAGAVVGGTSAYLFFSAPSRQHGSSAFGIGPSGARWVSRF